MSEDQKNQPDETTVSAEQSDTQEPQRPAMPCTEPGFLLAERIAFHALELKGEDLLILDLRTVSDVCDFFVLVSGFADVQVKAISRHVRDSLVPVKQKPVGIEGEGDGRWILLDYVDVVVHLLKPEVREYYQLERLWDDAPVMVVDEDHFNSDGFKERHPDLTSPGANPSPTSAG